MTKTGASFRLNPRAVLRWAARKMQDRKVLRSLTLMIPLKALTALVEKVVLGLVFG